jgi:hypothetical protein
MEHVHDLVFASLPAAILLGWHFARATDPVKNATRLLSEARQRRRRRAASVIR